MTEEIKKLDFSEFHDIEHEWFSGYCHAQPGGWKKHLSLWWTYLAKDRFIYYPLHRLGRHMPVEILASEGTLATGGIIVTPTGKYECWICGKPMGE